MLTISHHASETAMQMGASMLLLSPATYVIHVFGGVRPLARALGKSPGAISKWQKPKEQRGCGGIIPSSIQRKIIEVAREHGLDITPNDLIFGRKVSRAKS